MELNEYQKASRDTATYTDELKTIDGLTYSILALGGEVGELQNKLKKFHRAGIKPDIYTLSDELGDCLWYVASVAHELGFTLEEIARDNLYKLAQRKAAKTIAETGERT